MRVDNSSPRPQLRSRASRYAIARPMPRGAPVTKDRITLRWAPTSPRSGQPTYFQSFTLKLRKSLRSPKQSHQGTDFILQITFADSKATYSHPRRLPRPAAAHLGARFKSGRELLSRAGAGSQVTASERHSKYQPLTLSGCCIFGQHDGTEQNDHDRRWHNRHAPPPGL